LKWFIIHSSTTQRGYMRYILRVARDKGGARRRPS
jgi:hypothetical protein